jgi:hypothetical protein
MSDADNYLNSPLPGCAPATPARPSVGDLADLLELERFRSIPADDEGRYMLQELEGCLRKALREPEQLERVARMLAELSRLWGRHHGPGWVLTPQGEQALIVFEGNPAQARPVDERPSVRQVVAEMEHPSAGYFRRTGPTPIHPGPLTACDLPECRNAAGIHDEAQRAASAELATEQAGRPEPDGPEDDLRDVDTFGIEPFPYTDPGEGC